MIDRFAKRIKTASLKEQRLVIISVFILYSLFFTPLFAQSNLTYELKVATTGSVRLLDEFPDSYAAEKVNIKVKVLPYGVQGAPDSTEYVFADRSIEELATWCDSVYAYTDENHTAWTIWRTNIVPRNRAKRVLVQNAYAGFEQYVREQTTQASHTVAWLGFILAGLLLIAGIAYGGVVVYRRRAERQLPSVEQEMLRRKRAGNRRHIGSQLYLWLLLLVLYAPIALIAVFSFTESKVLGNWTGFSMHLYGNLFTGNAGAGLNSAIWYTVVIALIAAVASTILGTLAAIGIYNMRARQRKVVSFLNSVPMINPDIITGISLFLLFVALGMSQGLATVCIAHVVFCTPYVVLSVLPRLSKMNPNTYEAALDLGATPAQALRMVMLPELWPGMLSGFILALTLSVDDFGVTFFTKGSGGLETLSTFIYSDARKGGLTPELRPLFTIILLVMLTVLVVINIRAEKEKKN